MSNPVSEQRPRRAPLSKRAGRQAGQETGSPAVPAGGARSFSRLPSRASLAAVVFLLGVGVALPIALGAMLGSLFLPCNDDPAYRRIALDLYSTGRVELNGWNAMTLIGQVFFVQPFLWFSGGAEWAFTAATVSLACVGIVAAYALLRRVLSVSLSTLCVLGVIVFPGFVLNTTNYMTDVPSWAVSITCLALGTVALDQTGMRRWAWLAASLAVGCFGFSIRDFAIAAPVAVLLVAAFFGLGRRRGYWVAVALTAVVCAAIYIYATHLPGRGSAGGAPDISSWAPRTALTNLRHAVASVSLVVSPALVIAIASWWRRWRPIDALAGLVAASVFVIGPIHQAIVAGRLPAIVAANLLTMHGSLDTVPLYGDRPVLFADPWWLLINGGAIVAELAAGAVCGAAIGAFIRSTIRARRDGTGPSGGWRSLLQSFDTSTWALLAVFVLLYAVGMSVYAAAYGLFDRYVWPLVLPTYAILLRPPAVTGTGAGAPRGDGRSGRSDAWVGMRRRAAPALAAVLIGCLASISLVLMVNYDAFSTARWQMGTTATQQLGTPAGEVDAGLEWVVFHATGSSLQRPAPEFGTRYEAWWPSFHMCALVSSTPVTDPRVELSKVEPEAYRLFGFAGPWEPLYLYRVTGPGCP